MRAVVRGLADPEVFGVDRLDDLRRRAEDSDGPPPPLIFAPNHHSHVDTALMFRAVPFTWRKRLVVAAAADYFFDKRWKATLSALSLNAIPIDREATGRRSADMIRDLIDDGWSLVIYPEGGRSPDGWGQDFKAGAAYLSSRTGAPVVPVFLDGTGSIFGKGMKRPKPGRTRVVFGAPLHPIEGESTRRFNARIQAAVTTLADEATTDWWTAQRRAAAGTSPMLGGPDYTGWRRQWDLTDAPPPEHRRLAQAPHPPLARPRLNRRDLAGSVNCLRMRPRSGRICKEFRNPAGQPARGGGRGGGGGVGAVGGGWQVDRSAGVEVRPVRGTGVRRVELLDRDVELAGDHQRGITGLHLVRRMAPIAARGSVRGRRARRIGGVVGLAGRGRRRGVGIDELGARRDPHGAARAPGSPLYVASQPL